jgi:hypothetical protein
MICELVTLDDGTKHVVIRCVGENGVDDGGALDDWDSRWGPNSGYWYKQHWPALQRAAIGWGALVIAACVLLWFVLRQFVRPRGWRLTLMLLTAPLLWLTIWPDGDLTPLRVVRTSDHPGAEPWWIGLIHSIALIVFLLGLLMLIVLIIRLLDDLLDRKVQCDSTRCNHCNYDMRGSTTSVCPECGEQHLAHHAPNSTPDTPTSDPTGDAP